MLPSIRTYANKIGSNEQTALALNTKLANSLESRRHLETILASISEKETEAIALEQNVCQNLAKHTNIDIILGNIDASAYAINALNLKLASKLYSVKELEIALSSLDAKKSDIVELERRIDEHIAKDADILAIPKIGSSRGNQMSKSIRASCVRNYNNI